LSKIPEDAVEQGFLEVKPRNNESGEKMIRRFMKKAREDGVLREFSLRTFFEKPSVKKRRKKNSAKWNAKQHSENRKKD